MNDAEGRCAAVRVKLVGNTSLHGDFASRSEHWLNEIRGLAIQESQSQIWIEKIKFDTQEFNQQPIGIADTDGAIANSNHLVQAARNNPTLLTELGFDLSDLLKKLPGEVRDSLNPDSQEYFDEILTEAYSYLLGHLRLPSSVDRRSLQEGKPNEASKTQSYCLRTV